jgi:hypothetical protein
MSGACVSGKKVTFCVWTRASRKLTAISQRLDMDAPTRRPFVEDMLSYVKHNGWNRVNEIARQCVFPDI